MKASEIRDLSADELAAKERELREAAVLLRLRLKTNQLENPASVKATRRDIARIKTIQRQRQQG